MAAETKLSIVFPSVFYREGPQGIARFIRGVEDIGYDALDMFDHVVMGYPTQSRRAPFYTPQMPIMEAFMMLSHAAALTTRITLGTGVLVLPQRHPTLTAKQVSTLDTLSGGRVRLGVGSGWQASEYEALGEDYTTRGQRMDECIEIMRAYWRDEHVNYQGKFYQLEEMAMEPKPPQGAGIPIWIGGTKTAALKRCARMADGWMAMNAPGDKPLNERLQDLFSYAQEYGRDPSTIGLRMSLSPGPLDKEARKRFFAEPQLLKDRTEELAEMGFQEVSIDCVPIFQQGYRSVDSMLEYLDTVHTQLRA